MASMSRTPASTSTTTEASRPTADDTDLGQTHEYPVREYIGGMAQELAQMARWDGDEVLAGLLEAVSLRAESNRR